MRSLNTLTLRSLSTLTVRSLSTLTMRPLRTLTLRPLSTLTMRSLTHWVHLLWGHWVHLSRGRWVHLSWGNCLIEYTYREVTEYTYRKVIEYTYCQCQCFGSGSRWTRVYSPIWVLKVWIWIRPFKNLCDLNDGFDKVLKEPDQKRQCEECKIWSITFVSTSTLFLGRFFTDPDFSGSDPDFWPIRTRKKSRIRNTADKS